MNKTLKGRFIPKNKEKYIGDINKIVFRSSWELRLFKWLDNTPAVLKWASEEFSIPYLSPLDNKIHKYFPDAFILYKDKDGNLKREIIEIKPYKESMIEDSHIANLPDASKKINITNRAKWKAAVMFAEHHGMKFRVITENTLYKMSKPKKRRGENV